jgi:hypothetical protein
MGFLHGFLSGLVTTEKPYCIFDRDKINAWLARGAAGRVSVNFRKF